MRMRHIPEIEATCFEDLPHTLVVGEVAALCCISYHGALWWIRQGQLRARKAGGTWLVEKSSLLTFVKRQGFSLTFRAVEREF